MPQSIGKTAACQGLRDKGGTMLVKICGLTRQADVDAALRLGANFCKDASQGAAAATIELLGTVCALGIAMPLLLSVLKTIGGLL